MKAAVPELELLVDVLELRSDAAPVLISREPLGEGVVAGFDVTDGTGRTLTYFVDTSGRAVREETGAVAGPPDRPEARVWLHPADPHLPALAPVAFSHAASSLLARLGITTTEEPRLRVYRPGRRAVLSVATDTGTVWVKAVPPVRVAPIVDAHAALSAAGIPVPIVRGWSDQGLIVWDAAAGVPASESTWSAASLVEAVDDLRGRFAAASLDRPAATRLERRLDWYAERLAAELPPGPAEVAAGVVARARVSWEDPERVPLHGDLHFGQLFLDDAGCIGTVIDVDTAGRGAPSEDTAAFFSHAVASAMLTPAPADARVWELARVAFRRWDAPAMRARAATHLLGHALGAWEGGQHRRAERLLDAAASTVVGDVEALPGP